MYAHLSHLSLLARVLITCATLVGLGLANQTVTPSQDAVAVQAVAVRAVDSVPADVLAAALVRGFEPEAIPAPATPVATPTPVPVIPTQTPVPAPEWAQLKVDSPLRGDSVARSPAEQFLPRNSYLKLLGSEGSSVRVYYGGNGDEHKPGEGWVDQSDLTFSPAPRWVEARQATLMRSSFEGTGQVGSLPAGGVAEVLEDRGKRLHVFWLGDGFSRGEAEGWVDVDNLGPAGPLIVSERWGLRLLTRTDVQAVEAGQGVWLRVPYRTQLDGSQSAEANCGPSSVAMSLQFFGLTVPTGDLRRLADRLQGTADPDGGFQIEFLERAVERLGMKGLDLSAGLTDLKRWTLDDARRHLREGHPVVTQLRFRAMPGRENASFGEDHFVVLTGFLGDDFIYNDSVDVDGPGYGRVMSATDLKHAWGTSFFPFAGFAVSTP